MSAFFSLILPVYNVAPYLKRCLQSILNQDCTDYEIILVDDGSTDDSPAICDEYAQMDPNIRVIHKENGGLSSARNAGFAQAQGQYIWWIDSDDWIEPGALSLLKRAAESGSEIIRFNHYRVAQTTQPFISNAQPGLYEGKQCEILLERALYSAGKFGLSVWSHLYQRAFLLAHPTPFVSERVVGSEDYLFTLSIYPQAASILVLEECLYDYELRQGSLSQTYKKDLPGRYAALYTQLMQAYAQKGLLETYQERISHFYVWHLVRGTCLSNEYHESLGHPMAQGRQNVHAILRRHEVRSALRLMKPARLSAKDRILWTALYLRAEPLLYWLYVVKPGLRKGK